MILQTESLSKNFGGLAAVASVNLLVEPGTIHAVIGPNGAGKTTLFNLICGSIPPASGRVLFAGEDITGLTPDRLARKGLVRTFQRTSIFRRLSVRENVSLAIRSRRNLNLSARQVPRLEQEVREEAGRILQQVSLHGREHVAAGHLAHGNQRAVDIAIGLALEPTVILMDEPLAGMSRGDREGIAQLIRGLRERLGLTIVLVEHDIGMVMKLSDRITVMQHGRVIAEGAPAEIRDNADVKQAYLHGSFAA